MAAMSRHLALVAGLALLGLSMLATPAPAQFLELFGFPSAEPPPPLPPEVIAGRLVRAGYKLTRLRRAPQGYVADAYDPAGRPVRLVLDPIDGALLQRSVLAPPPDSGPGPAPGGGAAPEGRERPPARSAPSRRGEQSAQTPAPQREAAPKAGAAGEAPAPATAAPAPVKPVEPFVPKTGPGYSHGVPVNPLD